MRTKTSDPTAWAAMDPDETGEDDDCSLTLDEHDEVAALKRRRAYIIAKLYNIGESIRATEKKLFGKQGPPEVFSGRGDFAPTVTVEEASPASFVCAVDWNTGVGDGPGPKPLTDRAAEGAKTLLREFDADGDGCLSFEEFRAYLVWFGRDGGQLGKRLTTDREFWHAFIVDQAGLVSGAGTTGSTMSLGGNLTESGFIGHRRMIENEHPLEVDLLSAGLDLLPEYLQRWQRAKDAFDRIDSESVPAVSGQSQEAGGQNRVHCEGFVERGQVQLLLADAGEIMTGLRLEEELNDLARRRARVMLQLLQEKNKRKRLARGRVDVNSRTPVHNLAEKIDRHGWLAWFMSGRDKQEDTMLGIEKILVQAKTGLFRWLRNFPTKFVQVPRRALERLAQQGLVSSKLLAPLKESEGRATFRLAVGDVDDTGPGFSVSLQFLHKTSAPTDCPVESLPPGVGMAVTLALEAKDEIAEEELKKAARALEKVIRSSLMGELKRSNLFHSMRVDAAVTPPQRGMQPRVVRISLFWRSKANIDTIFRQLKLGLRPIDLIQELNVNFVCPLGLDGILESKRTVLNDHFRFSLTAEACFCGPLISKLLKEIVANVMGDIEQAEADSIEHESERLERRARTESDVPGMEHPLIAPKRLVGGAIDGCIFGGRLRTQRERRHKDMNTKRWLDRIWSLSAKLQGTRAFALDLESETPLEFLESSWARAYIPATWRSEEAFTVPGYVAKWFSSWKASFLSQVSRLHARFREHREGVRNVQQQQTSDTETAVPTAADMRKEDKGLVNLEQERSRLGMSDLNTTLGKAKRDQEGQESVRRLREAKNSQMKEYAEVDEALRACISCLLGPRELRVQSGPNVLLVEAQGLDVFDLLTTTAPKGEIGQDHDDEGHSMGL